MKVFPLESLPPDEATTITTAPTTGVVRDPETIPLSSPTNSDPSAVKPPPAATLEGCCASS